LLISDDFALSLITPYHQQLLVIVDKLDVIAPPFITKMEHKMVVVIDSVYLSATTQMSLRIVAY
jgi:hypothetical protein